MGDDILNLYGQFRTMQNAYVDIRAVENMTSSVNRWAMLGKVCRSHNADTAIAALDRATTIQCLD